MKQFIALGACLVFSCAIAQAQIFGGSKGDGSIGFGSKIHLSYLHLIGDSTQKSGAIGFGGGLIVPVRVTKLVYIQCELTWTRAKKWEVDKIAFPILVLGEEELGFRYGGGPYFSVITNETEHHIPMREFSYGIVADASYYLAGMQLGVRGSASLNDVINHDEYETATKQHLLEFELYYAVDIVALLRNL